MVFTQETRALCEALSRAIFARCPDAELREAKTQLGFFHGCGFAWLSQPPRRRKRWPEHSILLSLGLRAKIESPRIVEAVEAYPGRWTNHIPITSADEIDEELLGWLDEAHAFALERGLKRGKLK